MANDSTIIIGAGISGLAAAYELAKANTPVLLLEARDRLGGRIKTTNGVNGEAVELGAEFIHGEPPELWELIRKAGLPTTTVADRQQLRLGSQTADPEALSEALSRSLKGVEVREADQAFTTFLVSQPDHPRGWKRFARAFVEGFEAADADRISVHSVAREQEVSEQIHGERLFRIQNGYGSLVKWLQRRLQALGVNIHCGVVVDTIRWCTGSVEVMDGQGRRFEAARAIITLPLGILKAGLVKFVPELHEKAGAIQSLEMGHAMKVTLQFRSRFWPEENFGFIQSPDAPLPTCWSHERGHLLTFWAGGPKAKQLAGGKEADLKRAAMASLSRMFGVQHDVVEKALMSFMFHDWTPDPFTQGAYSYIPAGCIEAQESLAEPIHDTLFFAGEATALDAQLGTVHGALGSGTRAARQVLRSGRS